MRLGYRDDPETGDFPGERVFASKVDVKYVLRHATGSPDTLVICFSSAPPDGRPPLYTWHRLLGEFPCHRLFVLDDHGPREPLPQPNWYLGHGRDLATPDSICDLIDRIVSELEVARSNVVTVGSSLGGWAALYFGARIGAGHTLVAEPQTLLGDYLCGPVFSGPPFHRLAAHIAGGSSAEDAAFLDGLLFDAFRAADSPPYVQVMCGRKSLYNEAYVQPLVALLDELGCDYRLALVRGSDHVKVTVRFGAFMRKRLSEILAAPNGK
jgi:pimeloyl-ACP methyl ester carboxylesterase